jgi:dTDP-4-amino-4,6-dideoxygalactose transaminase
MGIRHIEIGRSAEPCEWDELAARLHGGFFHCWANAKYESDRVNVEPCFVRALDEHGECIGVAVGTISSPRFWPFSWFCRIATFAALPATKEGTIESREAFLTSLERQLRRKRIFLIKIASYDSPDAAQVLSALLYDLENRVEFYIDLSSCLEEIWNSLTKECRNTIRKAKKLGIEGKLEVSLSSLAQLQTLQTNALGRHGIKFQPRHDEALRMKEIILDEGRGLLLVAYLGNIAVCAAMFNIFNGNAYYSRSGSSEIGRKNAGPAFLIWRAIELLKANGAKRLNLGGATDPKCNDSQAYGLYSFKRDFGTTLISQPAGTMTINLAGAALDTILQRLRSVSMFARRIFGAVGLKVRSFFRNYYEIPWCVPTWGWKEFLLTLRCVFAGRTSSGTYPRLFVNAVKDFLGVQYALPLGRGRVAIEVALRAMGVGEGDLVVVPSYVCRSVLDPIFRVGARPTFADVSATDLHVTAETIRAALKQETKCVIVPHLFGNAAPIDEIEKLLQGTGIKLIDDAAQSFGARCAGRLLGTFGTCGIVSCGPGKALAGSAGGLFVTNDPELYEAAAAIPLNLEGSATVVRRVFSFWFWRRFRGWTLPLAVLLNRLFKMDVDEEKVGLPSAISNLESAIALAQVQASRSNVAQRRNNAETLLGALNGWARYSISNLSEDSSVVKLVLLLPRDGPDADWFIDAMARRGVECQRGYAPLHLEFETLPGSLPNTEDLWNRVVCIPIERGLEGFEHDFLLPSAYPNLG